MIRIFGYIWLLIRIQVLLTAVKLFTCRFQDNICCQFSSEEMLGEQKIYEFEINASLPVQKGGK